MDEQLHLADARDQRRHPPPALAFHVRPAGAARVSDGRPLLPVHLDVDRIGDVDAPQVTAVIQGECLEHNPAADPVGHAGLQHGFWLRVADGAPDRGAHVGVHVAVPAVRVAARPEPFLGQELADVCQQVIQLLSLPAGPGRAKQVVQVLIPVVIEVRLRHGRLPRPLPPLVRQRLDHWYRVGNERADDGSQLTGRILQIPHLPELLDVMPNSQPAAAWAQPAARARCLFMRLFDCRYSAAKSCARLLPRRTSAAISMTQRSDNRHKKSENPTNIR